MNFYNTDTDKHSMAELKIRSFLADGAFASLSELKAEMRGVFLGVGPLSDLTTSDTRRSLRLRLEPECGGEFTRWCILGARRAWP